MARKHAPSVKEDITANLIPMIDIMFLLLLFFMLGADMSQRELAELELAEADTIQEEAKQKTEDDEFRTTVNICHRGDTPTFNCPVNVKGICREMEHWLVVIQSREYDLETVKEEIEELAGREGDPDSAREADVDPVARRKMSKRKVSIRADKSAPYGHVQQLITLCGLAGIYKIEIGAAKPPVEK
jgi:biopolymer transport protein ExbD